MADNQTVKVGDKVRCLVTEFDVRKGELYEVLEVQDSGRVWFLDDESDRFYLEADEYEPLPVADATGKPAFKVGDRVHGTSGHVSGAGTIEACDESHMPYLIKFDSYPWALWCYREDVIALALTIETGKFYRTCDGRKVGPMDGWTSDRFRERAGDGRYWTVDGIGHGEAKREDLIAEWVDEPSSNDNQPVAEQQAGTVFIDVSKAGPSQLHLAKGRLVKVNQGFGFELARYGDYVWVDTGKKQPVVAHINEIKEAA